MTSDVPKITTEALLQESEPLPSSAEIVKGYTFEDEVVNYDAMFQCYNSTGFQATHFGQAISIVNDMVRHSSIHIPKRYLFRSES